MLPKNRRIPKQEFPYILSSGKRVSSPHLLLYISPIPQKKAQLSRFTFSVSKKIAKKAVERNKLRRWGYASIRNILKNIKENGSGYFLFFSFKKNSISLGYKTVETEIQELLSAADMLK